MRDTQRDLGQVCMQVHPARALGLDIAELKAAADRLARSVPGVRGVGFEEGEDDGRYLNIIFATEAPLSTWPSIRSGLLESAAFGAMLRTASMAMCTGSDGWNDYLLLYHHDPSVPTHGASEA